MILLLEVHRSTVATSSVNLAEREILGPTPDLQIQHLHFNRTLRFCLYSGSTATFPFLENNSHLEDQGYIFKAKLYLVSITFINTIEFMTIFLLPLTDMSLKKIILKLSSLY